MASNNKNPNTSGLVPRKKGDPPLNPTGRPKLTPEDRRLVRRSSSVAIRRMNEILEDDDSPTVSRVRAVIALGMIGDGLDRPTLTRITTDSNYRAQVEAISEVLRLF